MSALETTVVRGLEVARSEHGAMFQDIATMIKEGVTTVLEEVGRNVLQLIGDFFVPLFTGDFAGFLGNLHQLNEWLGDARVYDAVLEVINVILAVFGITA